VGYLLKTDRKNNINRATNFEKIPLFEQPKHTTLTVFSKKTKPDFEALSCIRFDGQPQLLVMGSGSTENRKKHYCIIQLIIRFMFYLIPRIMIF
jgi:hypothetical protein